MLTKKYSICGLNKFSNAPLNKIITPWTATNIYLVIFGISKVTSELGSDYIVQSFMTVVVGGVGNIWGTLAGAAMIGSLQKGIEWFNPSNTLAAQTYMIIFIILFIQFRPRGIVALRGRAADV